MKFALRAIFLVSFIAVQNAYASEGVAAAAASVYSLPVSDQSTAAPKPLAGAKRSAPFPAAVPKPPVGLKGAKGPKRPVGLKGAKRPVGLTYLGFVGCDVKDLLYTAPGEVVSAAASASESAEPEEIEIPFGQLPDRLRSSAHLIAAFAAGLDDASAAPAKPASISALENFASALEEDAKKQIERINLRNYSRFLRLAHTRRPAREGRFDFFPKPVENSAASCAVAHSAEIDAAGAACASVKH